MRHTRNGYLEFAVPQWVARLLPTFRALEDRLREFRFKTDAEELSGAVGKVSFYVRVDLRAQDERPPIRIFPAPDPAAAWKATQALPKLTLPR